MKNEKKKFIRLNEYRIRYNAGEGHAVNDSYHYFSAKSAEQALTFHESMMDKKRLKGQTVSVEKKDPYRSIAGVPPKWILQELPLNSEEQQ